MDKFLIVGGGGRESAFAMRLAEDSIVFALMGHENPTIVDCVRRTGGEYAIINTNNPEVVSRFAAAKKIDYAFVSADDPLANGVVDALLKNGIKAVGGTKAATRIEWDKIYAMTMMEKVCPEATPFFQIVDNPQKLPAALAEFEKRNVAVVVKPQGLTGGKGVKVMPEHLADYQDCADYATALFAKNPHEKVLLVEKIDGIEFTIMGITDGENLITAPASYDYPFRLENDLGAGTGGMGAFTAGEKTLPFMDEKDFADCEHIMQKILGEMRKRGLNFNGVLNGGFFKTARGIRFMEFNSRFGDPEALNILMILHGSFAQIIRNIWHKNLAENRARFDNRPSVVKYLVAHEYPETSAKTSEFSIDEKKIREAGVRIFGASCVKKNQHYQTLGKSRVIALGALADKISDASDLVNRTISKCITGNLEYRADIGSAASLEKLTQTAAKIQKP